MKAPATTLSESVLLMTSALQPPAGIPFVELRSFEERWHQTLCSLICWIRDTPLRRIVLCDNSGVSCDLSAITSFAREHGKEIETLCFQGDTEKLAALGKGYGEGEILAHAFAHSRCLRETESFYKITGRTFIDNFTAVATRHLRDPVVFSLPGVPWKRRLKRLLLRYPYFQRRFAGHSAYTVFYKSSPQFFRRHLLECYRSVEERANRWLEHCYFLPVLQHGGVGFAFEPILVGARGTSGTSYMGRAYPEAVEVLARRLADPR